ncbi:hypothetical protein ATER59S_00023 [Aquamicrobium terrae]
MGRVEAVIFASSEPVGREVLSRLVGRACSVDLLIDDIRSELRDRPVAGVARSYNLDASQLYAWRRKALSSGALTPLAVPLAGRAGSVSEPVKFTRFDAGGSATVEIVLADVVMRVSGAIDPDQLAGIISAVRKTWLSQTLSRIAQGWPASEIEALMPWNFRQNAIGWRMLPIHFGAWQTVYGWLRELARRFLFQTIHDVALMLDRERAGPEASPTAGVIDSQSVKAPQAETRGYDAGKKIVGRKRHIAVDTDGRLLMVNLTPADISDSAGAQAILDGIRKRWPWVKHLFADGAYDRLKLMDKAAYLDFVVEIIRRSDDQKGFEV